MKGLTDPRFYAFQQANKQLKAHRYQQIANPDDCLAIHMDPCLGPDGLGYSVAIDGTLSNPLPMFLWNMALAFNHNPESPQSAEQVKQAAKSLLLRTIVFGYLGPQSLELDLRGFQAIILAPGHHLGPGATGSQPVNDPPPPSSIIPPPDSEGGVTQ